MTPQNASVPAEDTEVTSALAGPTVERLQQLCGEPAKPAAASTTGLFGSGIRTSYRVRFRPKARLQQGFEQGDIAELAGPVEAMERLIAELRDGAFGIRMLPIGTTFSRFQRLALVLAESDEAKAQLERSRRSTARAPGAGHDGDAGRRAILQTVRVCTKGGGMYVSARSFRLSCLLLAFACACSDSDESSEGTKPHDGDEPLYLAAARVWDESSTTSYLHLVPSIDSDTEVDPSQAIELNGAAKLFSYGKNRWFAVGGGEAPTITRYTLDSRGRLKQGDSISFQPHGVTSLWDALYFVSPEQAYYPDTEGSQLIRWNPTTMEVLDAIPLPETVREGFISYYSMEAIVRDGLLIFSVGWFDWQETDSIRPETGLVVFDTDNDELVSFEVDSRCGGITQAIQLESGDTYFVSSALAGATHVLDRLETEPCALRLPKGETAFDADYLVHLKELTDGAIAGEPAPAGGDALFLRVFDEGEAEVTDGAKTYELTGQAVWSWARWDVESNELTPVDLPASTADTFWFVVDDKVLASETKDSETTLIDLTADGGPERTLTVPGFLQNIARVR